MTDTNIFVNLLDACKACKEHLEKEGYPAGFAEAEHAFIAAMSSVAKLLKSSIELHDNIGDEYWYREIVGIVDAQQTQETANEEHAIEFTAQELDAIEAGGRQAMLLKKLLSSIEPGTKHWANDPDRIDAATYAVTAAAEERKHLIYKLYAALLTSTKGETPEYLATRAILAADTIIKKL